MAKIIEIWVGRALNGDKIGPDVKKRTMKALAYELGMPYSTAKSKRPTEEGKKVLWVVGDIAWNVWFEKL